MPYVYVLLASIHLAMFLPFLTSSRCYTFFNIVSQISTPITLYQSIQKFRWFDFLLRLHVLREIYTWTQCMRHAHALTTMA